MAEERLQKLISAAGLMSRRAAEELIEQGKVKVNGYTARLGDKADLAYDEVSVDGKKLENQSSKRIYVMLNKPRGYVTTLSDDKSRPLVTDLLKDLDARVYPVGRLDMNSEGLLIFTNDGEFANRVMHPSHEMTKTYRVYVGGEEIRRKLELLKQPIRIDGKMTTPAKVEMLEDNGNNAVIQVIIKEGRNRQVRRLCENAGLKVKNLTRTAEGPVQLGSLKSGAWRHLTADEVRKLSQ